MSYFSKELINFTTQTKTRKMKKTTVDLDKTPEWVIGKWYYIAKDGMIGWYNLVELTIDATFPLTLMSHAGRTATLEGKHMGNDPARNVLEPWEAAIFYPECKDTAPDGVDWSVPELVLPECLTKDEFEALEYGREVFYYSAYNGTVRSLDNGVRFEDAYTEDCRVSGCFLTESGAETFKELYEAGAIEFVAGTWRMKRSDRASELRTVSQDLEAKNAELLADKQSLEYANNILKNDCDSYEKETIALRDVVDLLTAQNESMATTFDGLHSKFDKAVYELTLAKEIIANLAIRLQKHEDI